MSNTMWHYVLSEIFGYVNDFSVFYMDSKDTVGGQKIQTQIDFCLHPL